MANKDRETSKLGQGYAKQLLAFNVQKQKIANLCNVEFEDDLFDDAKNDSSWNRAINGKEVWEGLIDALDNLLNDQINHPRKYLPADGPPDEGLQDWMKQIAPAPWWRDVLQVSASQSAFNAWFSNRPMGKAKVAEVKAAVDAWWARLMVAVDRAEQASRIREMAQAKGWGKTAHSFDSHFFTKVVEEGMAVDDARALYVEMNMLAFRHTADIIDLSDPQDPLTPMDGRHDAMYRDDFAKEFDAMHKAGYPNALPSVPPDFDQDPFYEVKRWGGEENEECPKNLNESLYGLWYRVRRQRFWNAEMRKVDMTHEIVEVSDDGVTWRAANEREKRGWDAGTELFLRGLVDDGDGRSQHEREVDELRSKIKRLRFATQNAFTPEERASAQAELTDAEKHLSALR